MTGPLRLAQGLGLLGALVLAAPAMAHQLNVFAFVEAGEVVVEAKFTSGKVPVAGNVAVKDAQGVLIETIEIGPEGVTRFPLMSEGAKAGLLIEVEVSEGHSNYWILTPDDMAAGAEPERAPGPEGEPEAAAQVEQN